MEKFELPDAVIKHINLRAEGQEKEKPAADLKIVAKVDAELIDSLWLEDLNEGDVVRCFWLENESGDPRFPFMTDPVKFGRSYRNVSIDVMGMELVGSTLGKFSFEPMSEHKAMLTFTASIHEPPTFAVDRLHAMLFKEQPIKFEQVIHSVTEEQAPTGSQGDAFAGTDDGPDPLYEQAVMIVRAEDGVGSVSFVQRKLQIGYNRAARLMEWMEKHGVVSAPNSAGRREVL